jgi:hypothetical protein
MNEHLSLRDASVQDIQLELIRRTRFNSMHGERIVASLLRHRDLWLAVLLDRPGLADYTKPDRLLMAGLIKLRDLPDNLWNADMLFVLTQTGEQARMLARIAEEEEWVADVVRVHENQQEIDRALGTGRGQYGLLSVWWD